jgi:inner membrane protein
VQKTLFYKLAAIAGLTLLIYIPLAMIQSTIGERMDFHRQAVQSIATDSVHEQAITGPIMVVPYTEEYTEEQLLDPVTGRKGIVKRSIDRRHLVYPNQLQVQGTIDTDNRYRGIHKVLVYSGQYLIAGDFVLPAKDVLERARPDSKISICKSFLALSISDVRGIRNIPKIMWDGREIEFEQGTGLTALKEGLHASLDDMVLEKPVQVKFSFTLGLDGIERLHFSPVAKNNRVMLQSKWPHPQFGGRFMPSPKDRRIDENGFAATWNISSLATNAQQQLSRLESAGSAVSNSPADGKVDYFSVGFIEPVNIYSQADRATKYGLLFVCLTFAAFFLFEIIKQLQIHPIQYALVGLALALFFLLLVSLSEHIPFIGAYLIASTACILLISFYVAHVLRNWKRGFGFGIGLTALYGVLYGLLQSENNALVMGSILLFSVLAAIMIATRKIDWYGVGKGSEGAPAPMQA